MLTPRQLYDAYPDADLLGVEPPYAGPVAAHEYAAFDRQVVENGGDTLFLFLLRELCAPDECTPDDLLDRCDSAIRDIDAVRSCIARSHE